MLIEDKLLPFNPQTRSGIPLTAVGGVVIHWADAPQWTSDQLTEYLASLPDTEPGRYASYHYVVGLDGEINRLIPEDECAWHAGPSSDTRAGIRGRLGGLPNWYTIGICMCHPDTGGAFLRATWRSAAELAADVLRRNKVFRTNTVLRHHDCTGKRCPGWFTDHPADWAEFVHEVRSRR